MAVSVISRICGDVAAPGDVVAQVAERVSRMAGLRD